MHFNRESKTSQTITSYSETHVTINSVNYQHSLWLSRDMIEPWPVHSIKDINADSISLLMKVNPEIILIGISPFQVKYTSIIAQFTPPRTSIEVMPLGGACRTFNILLSEGRKPVLGIIFNEPNL